MNNLGDNITFLIVDDEDAILLGLRTVVSKNFPKAKVLTSKDGLEAWNIINMEHPSIVISDISMPGLNGLQLCSRVREKENFNDIYFIIVTASSDSQQRVKALEIGADDFINKPFVPEELIARLRSAARFSDLQKKQSEENKLLIELAEELEKHIQDLTLLAVKFLQARIPTSTDMLKKVASASVWIAKQLGEVDEEHLRDIEIASYLCYSGKIFLPDHLIKTPVVVNGRPSNAMMFQVPNTAREILSTISRFKDVGNILYHVFENFDGSGFPGRIQSWQIPLGSRIIRVVLDYEEMLSTSKVSSKEIVNIIQTGSKRLYDHRVVVLLEQWVASNEKSLKPQNEKPIQIYELQEGMILTRDIITNSGMKILPSGVVLRDNMIKKIIAHNSTDPILGNVYIRT